MDRATQDAWEQVQFGWDEAYEFTHDSRFHAARRDDGTVLTADTPDRLSALILVDYRARKVPRDLP